MLGWGLAINLWQLSFPEKCLIAEKMSSSFYGVLKREKSGTLYARHERENGKLKLWMKNKKLRISTRIKWCYQISIHSN